jgi:transcriptional regulator with XRE-family HTH domain
MMPSKRDALPMRLGQAEVLSRPSSSRLANVYKTDEFLSDWSNDIQFHVARNLLHLRRYRKMSQTSVAQAVGTSQSAIARIESGQENITLDTLRRLVASLKGRFQVSIPPEECAPSWVRPWWEASDSTLNQWAVISCIGRRTCEADQVIVGLERHHELDRSTSTLPTGTTMLIAESHT